MGASAQRNNQGTSEDEFGQYAHFSEIILPAESFRYLFKLLARAADKPHIAPSLPHSGTGPEYLPVLAPSADNPANTTPPDISQTALASTPD